MSTSKISGDIGVDTAFVGIEIRINLHRRDQRSIGVKGILEGLNRGGCGGDVGVVCDPVGRSLPVGTRIRTIPVCSRIRITALQRQPGVLNKTRRSPNAPSSATSSSTAGHQNLFGEIQIDTRRSQSEEGG